MAEVKPFRALRYDEQRAGPLDTLVAPPFDVIGPEERLLYLKKSPHNIVHLTLPDSEEQAARDLADWRAEGILAEDDPAVWWLEQDYTGPDGVARTRKGLVAALRIEPYESGVVLPHERTDRGPKEGRLRLLRATRAQLEPIFLLHEGRAPLDPPGGDPELEAKGAGAVSRLWRIADTDAHAEVQTWFSGRTLLIADGHHRYETTLAFHAEDGSPESAWMMVVLVSRADEGLEIFATHRVAKRIGGAVDGEHAAEPREALRVIQHEDGDRPAAVLYRKGETIVVRGDEPGLDASFVEGLGLEDVSYTPSVEEAVTAVDRGEAEAAILLRPARIEQVAAVAERGETMPQKSTFFFPKLLSGLLLYPLQ